MDSRNARAFFL